METKPRILIAGGSGLIGTAISKEAFARGYNVTILSRNAGPGRIIWNPAEMRIELTSPMEYDAIINMTGASLSEGRWTDEKKKEIVDSRLHAADTLETYLREGKLKTKVYIGASGIGIYGNRGDEIISETSPIYPGDNWLIKLVMDWEQAHLDISKLGIRTAVIRTGIVLSREGGALYELLEKAKLGVLPYFGNGQQIWAWIHIIDLVNMMLFIIKNQSANGIYLGTSPNPVSNQKIVTTFNQYLKPKRIVAGVPRFVLSIMLGEMHHVLFESCNAIPERIMEEGYHFRYPTIQSAAED
ncbi:MAG: TIGR01777 family oxidoreductase, partial [Saprospiraceae bacterium]